MGNVFFSVRKRKLTDFIDVSLFFFVDIVKKMLNIIYCNSHGCASHNLRGEPTLAMPPCSSFLTSVRKKKNKEGNMNFGL